MAVLYFFFKLDNVFLEFYTSYKIKIGKIWEEVAGRDHFSYFMVFKAGSDADSSDTEGAVSLYQIADILKAI